MTKRVRKEAFLAQKELKPTMGQIAEFNMKMQSFPET